MKTTKAMKMTTMTTAIEREVKLEINQAQYKSLCSISSNISSASQLNTFFDTPQAAIRKSGHACRIRISDDLAEVTVKGHNLSQTKSISCRMELEEEIPLQAAKSSLKGFKSQELKCEPILFLESQLQGHFETVPLLSFSNHRSFIPWQGWLLEIDCTTIQDQVFYELEAEARSEDEIIRLETDLKQFFQQKKWQWQPAPYSKFHRAQIVYGLCSA